MLFSHKQIPERNLHCKLGNQILENVDHYRYLGLELDSQLNYNLCIKKIIQKINHKLWLFAKLRDYMTQEMSIKIFKGMVLPYFDYGDVIYMGAKKELLKKLQILQNRALKVCLKVDKKHPTYDIHKRTKVKLLENRRIIHLKTLAYGYSQNINLLTKPQRNTRANNAPLLKQTRSQIKAHERSTLEMAARVWNAQTVKERQIPDLKTYKKYLCKIKLGNPH